MNPARLDSAFPVLSGLTLDLVAKLSLVAIILVSMTVVMRTRREVPLSWRQIGFILIALLLSTVMSLETDLGALGALWVGLIFVVLVAAVSAPASRAIEGDDPRLSSGLPVAVATGWVTLLVVGGPALLLANALLVASSGGSLLGSGHASGSVAAILILVGAVTAGLAPLDRWRRAGAGRPEIAVVSAGCLPIIGVELAARGAGYGFSRPDMTSLILLLVVGAIGVSRAVWSLWRRRRFEPGGVVERGLAFLVLAAPISFAAPLAVGVVGIGSLAHLFLPRPAVLGQSHEIGAPRDDGAVIRRPIVRARPSESLHHLLTALLVEPVATVEQRVDLATGVLVALAVLFVFVG